MPRKKKVPVIKEQYKDFADLVGETGMLYQCIDANRFQLGSIIFEVMEDEQDGYRSSMDKVKIVTIEADRGALIEEVRIEEGEYGYQLRGVDSNHVWYEFGTDNSDDYYPLFVFRFHELPSADDVKSKLKL